MADALEEVAALPDVNEHPRSKALSGSHKGGYRLRVGTYRAIFWIEKIQRKADGKAVTEANEDAVANADEDELYVDYVGPRGDAY
ncbi:MAG: hypothetical protein L3J39_06665 [Verrucomicrobiales bacterium]|nr:hypothetical protein [Verrucomicrobiales bacterium]